MLFNSDTIIENIYHLLWQRDENFDTEMKVQIPDTLVYRSGVVENWYFTSQSGQILVKKNRNMTKQSIWQYFGEKNTNKCDILAYLISQKTIDEEDPKQQNKQLQNEQIVIQYLDKKMLREFIFSNTYQHYPCSVLQKFIEPYGEKNQLIEAVWSPSMCVFTQRVNQRNLYDNQYDIYEKGVTFDGGEVYSNTVNLNGEKYSQQMRQCVQNIVQHVSLVTNEKTLISRMVLYFKADQDQKIYFLYCSSIRIKQDQRVQKPYVPLQRSQKIVCKPLNIDANYLKPDEIRRVLTVNTMRPQKMHKDIICIDCEEMVQEMELTPVQYKLLIDYFDKFYWGAPNNMIVLENDEKKRQGKIVFMRDTLRTIPNLFQKLYPQMEVQDYEILKNNNHFNNQTLLLCENCFLKYTQNKLTAGASPPKESFQQIKPQMAEMKHIFNDSELKEAMDTLDKQFATDLKNENAKLKKDNFIINNPVNRFVQSIHETSIKSDIKTNLSKSRSSLHRIGTIKTLNSPVSDPTTKAQNNQNDTDTDFYEEGDDQPKEAPKLDNINNITAQSAVQKFSFKRKISSAISERIISPQSYEKLQQQQVQMKRQFFKNQQFEALWEVEKFNNFNMNSPNHSAQNFQQTALESITNNTIEKQSEVYNEIDEFFEKSGSRNLYSGRSSHIPSSLNITLQKYSPRASNYEANSKQNNFWSLQQLISPTSDRSTPLYSTKNSRTTSAAQLIPNSQKSTRPNTAKNDPVFQPKQSNSNFPLSHNNLFQEITQLEYD